VFALPLCSTFELVEAPAFAAALCLPNFFAVELLSAGVLEGHGVGDAFAPAFASEFVELLIAVGTEPGIGLALVLPAAEVALGIAGVLAALVAPVRVFAAAFALLPLMLFELAFDCAVFAVPAAIEDDPAAIAPA
jgi:hypothetical protein